MWAKPLLLQIARWLPQPPSTNYRVKDPSPSPYDLLPPKPVIYDIGGKDARGRYFEGPPLEAVVICIDIQSGPGVDVVADAQQMPEVQSDSADCAFLVSVLQHLPNPQKAIDEAYRVLRPGGVIYVNVPFIFAYHKDPDDYQRFSVRGLEVLCSRFEQLGSGSTRGPCSTCIDLVIRLLAILCCFNSDAVYAAIVYIGKWAFFWVKYLDFFVASYSMAYLLAGAPYFVGRKPLSLLKGPHSM